MARDGTIFDLFDPSGRFLGEVELPVRVRAYDLAGELLATEIESEDGAPMIAVWRVRRLSSHRSGVRALPASGQRR